MNTLLIILTVLLLLAQYTCIMVLLIHNEQFFEYKTELNIALIPFVPFIIFILSAIFFYLFDKDIRIEIKRLADKLK